LQLHHGLNIVDLLRPHWTILLLLLPEIDRNIPPCSVDYSFLIFIGMIFFYL